MLEPSPPVFPLTSRGALAVFGTVLREGPLPRADAARRTGLTAAAVTRITAPLVEAGFLRERGGGRAGVGRPAIDLEVVPEAAWFSGWKVTADELVGVRMDLAGTVRTETRTRLDETTASAVVEGIVAMDRELDTAVPESRGRVATAGVAISGDVDRASGRVEFSPFVQWRGVPLGSMVGARLGIPVLVENDVRALTAAEQWFGDGVGAAVFAVVTIGAGIGCGLFVNGAVVEGAHGVAGELGHLPLADDARPCYCGGTGCVETVASTPSILRDVSAALGRPVQTLEDALAVARGGDGRVRRVFTDAGRILGRAVASVANLLGPERVVLTGEGISEMDLLDGPVREVLAQQSYGRAVECELIVRPLPFEAWARGAATVALESFLLRVSPRT